MANNADAIDLMNEAHRLREENAALLQRVEESENVESQLRRRAEVAESAEDALRQRVEELERERDAARGTVQDSGRRNGELLLALTEMRERAEAAEAKLAKVVEAGERLCAMVTDGTAQKAWAAAKEE